MNTMSTGLFVGPQRVMNDWGVSRTKAYKIIKELNTELKREYPAAIIIPGKINRAYYEKACAICDSRS